MRGSARSGRSPQPSPPASTSPSSPSSSRHASIRRARFLRGSIVPSPRTAGPPRSAAGPSAPRPSASPGRRVDDPLLLDAEGRRQVGRGEAGVREDDVAGRRRVPGLVRMHRDGAGRAPLRVVERHEVVEDRRAHAAALRRVHPLAEDEGVQTPREQLHGRPAERGSSRYGARARPAARRAGAPAGMPSSAARIARGPRRLVGANATSSCRPAAAAHMPASEPRM